MLGVVSLRQDSPDAADLAVSLAALKDWTFLFGPGFIVPFGNGLILGYLMYNSGLVPRLHGLARTDRRAAPPDRERRRALRLVGRRHDGAALLVIPEFLWELFLGIYCGGLGIPEGRADPFGAQHDGSADRPRVNERLSPLARAAECQEPHAQPVQIRHQPVDHDRHGDRREHEGAEHGRQGSEPVCERQLSTVSVGKTQSQIIRASWCLFGGGIFVGRFSPVLVMLDTSCFIERCASSPLSAATHEGRFECPLGRGRC